jgi:ectoine hydroxylase-related dioxygenase (phytanoyl-CoA dioxygenase family)
MKPDEPVLNLPWVESPFFKAHLDSRCKSPEEKEAATRFHEDGYLILRNVLSDEMVDRVKSEVKPLFRPGVPEGTRSEYRVQDGYKESPAVKEVAGHPRILETLRFLYGRRGFPFQTLNFLRGSQQRTHSDFIHFNSLPARFMCGAWAALEDITLENGPLFYYKGSHKLPQSSYYDLGLKDMKNDYRRYEDIMEGLARVHGFQKENLLARKGDVLIWSSNLLHGGDRILKEGSTRWSQVTHYYFEDCLYYTPMYSNFITGALFHREVRDIVTGRFVDQTYNGRSFSAIPIGGGRYRITERLHWLGRGISFIRRSGSILKRKLFPGSQVNINRETNSSSKIESPND